MNYHLLGRSGLRVSPFCLGTMTFGTEWGWGSEEGAAREVFQKYLEAGGNFIDTADGYTEGKSEELIGKFVGEMGNRDELVIATKFTFNRKEGNPNMGGNGRKNIYRALEGSLNRLKTDYVDLYWLHAWDTRTPVEEVMDTVDSLIKAGRIRYFGLSDVPAWYFARAQSISGGRVSALQLEYSLVERNIEREHVPAALHLDAGICPWSPLGGGFLSGKYTRGEDGSGEGEGRLATTKGSPVFDRFFKREKNWEILETLVNVAKEIDRSPAQVAINWITTRPAVASSIVGATKVGQLEDTLQSLDFEIPSELRKQLDEVGRPDLVHPYSFHTGRTLTAIDGKASVTNEPPWFRG